MESLPLYWDSCHVRWPCCLAALAWALRVCHFFHPPQIYFVWSFVFQLRRCPCQQKKKKCRLWLCEPSSLGLQPGAMFDASNIFIAIKRWREGELLSHWVDCFFFRGLIWASVCDGIYCSGATHKDTLLSSFSDILTHRAGKWLTIAMPKLTLSKWGIAHEDGFYFCVLSLNLAVPSHLRSIFDHSLNVNKNPTVFAHSNTFTVIARNLRLRHHTAI